MSAVERETWVDNVKVIACILVVLGHFFQGITNENILPRNDLFQWFNQTIYYFHVPLFFLFLVTPTFRNKTMAVGGLVIAMLAKIIGVLAECDVKAISYILSHEIWFVIGMCISVWNIKAYIKKSMIIIPIVTGVVFGVLSVLIYKANMQHAMASFIMGLIACCSIIMMVMILFKGGNRLRYLLICLSTQCRFS